MYQRKLGTGISEVLEQVVTLIPPPEVDSNSDLQASIIDSWFDNYLGVVSLVRVVKGKIKKGDNIEIFSRKEKHSVDKIGVFTPKIKDLDELSSGQVGFVCASIKEIRGAPVGIPSLKPIQKLQDWMGLERKIHKFTQLYFHKVPMILKLLEKLWKNYA